MSATEEFFIAGRVVGLHGLKGDLKVRPTGGQTSSLPEATTVRLVGGGAPPRSYRVERAVWHKGMVLLRVVGIADATAAAPLVGYGVEMPLAELGELDDDEYYWHELDGMTVVDARRGTLGTIVDLLDSAAHDIYVVEGPRGEVLIPAAEPFVVAVDRQRREMRVDLPDGLVAGDDDAL